MVRVCLILRVYCSGTEEDLSECREYFHVEVPLHMFGLFTRGEVTIASLASSEDVEGWHLDRNREALCAKHRKERRRPAVELIDNDKEEPTDEVLERARKLQALATDKAATEGERRNAWDSFTSLWKKYRLPNDIGME